MAAGLSKSIDDYEWSSCLTQCLSPCDEAKC